MDQTVSFRSMAFMPGNSMTPTVTMGAQGTPDSERQARRVAYFSMEIAITPDIYTYSGGLGVLAGDTLRSAADLQVPMVGVTLAHRKGYFRQTLDHVGNQSEAPAPWDPSRALELMEATITVAIEG